MKTAISVPDDDFQRFERIAARNGMSRSEFYRRAGAKLADELEGASRLTAIADSVLTRVGRASDADLFLSEAQRVIESGSDW
ncbi:ribbon-helix-helix protein, CopG family [Gryllotalpicola protaetiae]|uniref:Ribbon-helix-helix protein, CopG family n=1 Tax=Gryllotalpicola protaetiae TaxID=2419771 RepID=A0A387BRJ4_9MICO|nr:ribbon-helix-helix protein, CopG family [Gryllotalpicola protaetiae]AYG03690.1 ribbon-helix-helix protein, CopG family [Gryllotalpicola protaetiae]